MATTLAKLYPRIDKICDAAFIKKAVGTTKKDSVVFFSHNTECRSFFENKESDIDSFNDIIRNDIMDFLRSENMQLAVTKFRSEIKEKVAIEKASKVVLQKQAIIEEFLREQEQLKKDNEERIRLGLAPKNTTFESASNTQKGAENASDEKETASDEKETAVESCDGNSADEAQSINKNKRTNKKGSENEGTESSEETQMNLEDFLALFKAVHEQGLIVFKHGDVILNNIHIDLDQEAQKIMVYSRVAPMITLKKRTVV